MRVITLYYDVVSPYSWLAFEALQRYESIWNIPIVYQPFFLGGVMKKTGNKPPGANPFKAQYMNQDIQRNSGFFNVPLNLPPTFPMNTIHAQRILIQIKNQHPDKLTIATRILWQLFWRDGQDITSEETIRKYFTCFTSADFDDILMKSKHESVKNELMQVTDKAVDQFGAFGAPWIVVHDDEATDIVQCFWGSDRLEQLAYYLKKPWRGPQPTNASKI